MRHCLVFLSQPTGPVRLAVPVNSEKFDSRRPSGKKKLKNPPRPFGQKKNQNSETQKSPEKEFKTHHKHFKSEISRLGKIFRDPLSQGTILYRLYPFAEIVAFPCRLLALNLPVSYFSSQCLACDKHGPAILS